MSERIRAHVVEILAALMTTPVEDRMDVLAIAIRAAIDANLLEVTRG